MVSLAVQERNWGGVQTAGLNDGLIDDNTATTAGGGVNITSTFTMRDGS